VLKLLGLDKLNEISRSRKRKRVKLKL
jgi:hypothetical protein